MSKILEEKYPLIYYFLNSYLEVHLLEGDEKGRSMSIQQIVDLFKSHNNNEIENSLIEEIEKIRNNKKDLELIKSLHIYQLGYETEPQNMLAEIDKSFKIKLAKRG